VAGAADMMSRRGLNATSVRELAKHAQAPLGSTYHYFPGGKYQLAAEAVRWADELATRTLLKELKAGPLAGLRAFLKMWRKILTDSEFRAGCPVLAALRCAQTRTSISSSVWRAVKHHTREAILIALC
jgi:AcrR family transcriptional regulator